VGRGGEAIVGTWPEGRGAQQDTAEQSPACGSQALAEALPAPARRRRPCRSERPHLERAAPCHALMLTSPGSPGQRYRPLLANSANSAGNVLLWSRRA